MLSIGDKKYYQTNEACVIAGITKNTFFRWVDQGVFRDVALRDRRGWRLFTQADMERLKAEANKVQTDQQENGRQKSSPK